MAEPAMLAKCASEFVGTYLLILTVGCCVLGGAGIWAGIAIASVLMVSIYSLGGISGANFNPAVSFSLALSKQMGGPGMSWSDASKYMATQAAAGVLAGLTYVAIFQKSFNLTPGKGFGWLNSCLAELLYTFMLCFVVLNVAAAKKNSIEKGQYYGIAIGFVIIAGAYGAGAISGGCFNPAVALGVDAASAMLGFGNCFAWIVAEIIGAALATVAFKVVRPEDFGEPSSDISIIASEFLGTFFLVLTVGLNVMASSKAAAFSIGAGLTSMIYALGDVSGAHFNPAVTTAIRISGRCPDLNEKMGKYIGAQMAGGILAAMLYSIMYVNQSFPLGPAAKATWGQVFVAEFVFTFILAYVVLCVAVSERTKASHMFGLAIGACIIVGGNAIGGISGGSLNPAVSFGISASDAVFGKGGFGNAVIYSAIEAAAGAAAAVTFKITHDVDTIGFKGY
eukprot:TRINITY_DN2423_c1_g1_i1.p1 TRINITY_DN2423_c1_g1~~TRINITY_DN2423_c1_g1_i1.p1  ORF type:complete len:451 (-),score=106.37 TRINITY_DN2423_c1_g1_i1:64-1416(-)